MVQNKASKAFHILSKNLIKEHWYFFPTRGHHIGQHEYDGRLPDLSPSQNARRISELQSGLRELHSINTSALGDRERMSHQMLRLFLQYELFVLNDLKPFENNPMRYIEHLDVSGYIRRDYAPLEDRLRSASLAMKQVPEFLQVLDKALHKQMSSHVVGPSMESYSGMAHYYREDLAKATEGITDSEVIKAFNRSRETAATALDRFVRKLKERGTGCPESFSIGSKLYAKMLSTGEGLDASISQIETIGQANLDNNLSRLKYVAQQIAPGRSVTEIVDEIGRNHPKSHALIRETQNMLEEIRQALIDFNVLTIPSENRCQVIETPTYMRYAFAAMDTPGSLETKATESFYYITPAEAHWNNQQQEEWLSNFNYDTLKIISIHEVYPGHFVHNLHNRYGEKLPLVNRVATSYSFTEGWAHYTEEMMLETEYGDSQPRLQLTQLLEALVRNCRYMCSLQMHTGDMTLNEATRFFMENAFMAELPARKEALRGTFDPGYLNYTLGKLMILKLRYDFKKEQGGEYSLKGFHDRLLSFGGPAIPLLRSALLSEPGKSPL